MASELSAYRDDRFYISLPKLEWENLRKNNQSAEFCITYNTSGRTAYLVGCELRRETSNTDDDKAVIIDSWRVIMTTTDGRKIELTEDIPVETCRDIDTVIQLFYETSYPDIFS